MQKYHDILSYKTIIDKVTGTMEKELLKQMFSNINSREELDEIIKRQLPIWNKYLEKRADFYQSDQERVFCLVLDEILKDINEFKYYEFIVNPQQSINKYISFNKLNDDNNENFENKNRWITSDIVIEIKTYDWFDGKKYPNLKCEYLRPVLAIEIDGDNHNIDNARNKDNCW